MNQDRIFMSGEGDRWFERNRADITGAERLARDPVLRMLEVTGFVPRAVLEVGASNGYRLDALRARFGCRAVAVEASKEAIDDGRSRYPKVEFTLGAASRLPIVEDSQFDLVIVNGVLCWVDRSTLIRSMAEVDRMLADRGFAILGDFYPAYPQRVSYHHLPGADVWTYKQNYLEILTGTNLYELVAFLSYEVGTYEFKAGVEPDRRGAVAMLQKTLGARYPTGSFPAEATNAR